MSKIEQKIAAALGERRKVDDAFEQRMLAGARRRMTRAGSWAMWWATATVILAAIILWGVGLPRAGQHLPATAAPAQSDSSERTEHRQAVLRLIESAAVETSLRDGADWVDIEQPLWQSLSDLEEGGK